MQGFRSRVDLLVDFRLRAMRHFKRYLEDANHDPKPFIWTADPDKIIAAVNRGHEVLDSIH